LKVIQIGELKLAERQFNLLWFCNSCSTGSFCLQCATSITTYEYAHPFQYQFPLLW